MSDPINVQSATQSLPTRLFAGMAKKRKVKDLKNSMQLVEAGMMENLRFTSPVADASARYLAEAGGKRVRPMLTLLTAQLGDGVTEQVIKAAQAIELTHLASLYHDDVMDEASLRRGVPAAHKRWNNSVAILAGDLLFARASNLVSGLGEEVISLQSKTFERLCLGQLHETVGPEKNEDPLKHYLTVLADKTGSLIACAARMGALVGNAPVEYFDAVTEYGEQIGLAFQLIDDVIDLSASRADTGKRAGTDLRAGVVTLPVLLLHKSAETNPADADLLARISQGVEAVAAGADASVMDTEVAELYAHEMTRETERRARAAAQTAVAQLDVLPDGEVKSALIELADSIVNRVG